MSVRSNNFAKAQFNAARAAGEQAISSDAFLQIVGEEALGILCKQFPWPVTSTAGEIEVALPMGGAMWQPQNLKTNQQGSISFYETKAGDIDRMLERIAAKGGKFDAIVYAGTPTEHTHKKNLYGCFLQIDPVDRDWENRGQVMLMTGTIFYNYFGSEA